MPVRGPAGRFYFHILGALAQMERELIRERTMAGLSAARARGRKGGAKPKLSAKQIECARKLLADRNTSVKDVADSLGVSRATVYRNVIGDADDWPHYHRRRRQGAGPARLALFACGERPAEPPHEAAGLGTQ